MLMEGIEMFQRKKQIVGEIDKKTWLLEPLVFTKMGSPARRYTLNVLSTLSSLDGGPIFETFFFFFFCFARNLPGNALKTREARRAVPEGSTSYGYSANWPS